MSAPRPGSRVATTLLLALLLALEGVGATRAARAQPATGRDDLAAFGVVGDGRADDADALQRAIDTLGDVYLPRGTYRLTRPLRIELDRVGPVSITGAGGAVLRMEGPGPALHLVGTHAGTASPATVAPAVWARPRSPRVAGIEIVGAHPAAVGIRAEGTMQPLFTALTIRRTRDAIHLTGRNRNVIISDSHLYENAGAGVLLDGVDLHQINIVGVHISYNRGGGIVVRRSEVRNLQIGTCDIEANMDPDGPPTANILIDTREGVVREGAIVGCTIQHTADAPESANIRFIGAPGDPPRAVGRFTIADNVLSDAVYNIHLQRARGVTLTGNTLWKARAYSLLVEESAHIVVAANLFERNPDYLPADTPDAVLFRDSRACTLDGLHLQGTRAPAEGAALVLQRCTYFNITNALLLDTETAGVLLEDVRHTRLSDSIIRPARGPAGRPGVALRVTGGGSNLIVDNLLEGAVLSAPGTAVLQGNHTPDAAE